MIQSWVTEKKRPWRESVIASLFFLPAIMMIWFGQLSLFIYFFLIAGFHAYHKRRDTLAGILWVPLTLKPHLVYLTLWYLALQVAYEKRWKVFIGGITTFLLLNVVVLLYSPTIFSQYANIDRTPLIYQSSTLPTLVRIYLEPYLGRAPSWPVFALPLLSVTGVTYWWLQSSKKMGIGEAVSLFTALSLSLAPYAWMYDYSLCVVVQIVALLYAVENRIPSERDIGVVLLPLGALVLGISIFYVQVLTPLGWLGIGAGVASLLPLRTFLMQQRHDIRTCGALGAIQFTALVTGCYFKEMVSFMWFPLAMLAVHYYVFPPFRAGKVE